MLNTLPASFFEVPKGRIYESLNPDPARDDWWRYLREFEEAQEMVEY